MYDFWMFLKSNPNVTVGVIVFIIASYNISHANNQQDAAFDLPEDSSTDRICRNIRLLETRVWVMGWNIVAVAALFFVFK